MKKIRIYIGHKLTNISPEFDDLTKRIKGSIKADLEDKCEFLEFLGTTKGTPAMVYGQDIITNIGTCDLFVCIVDQEAIGVGIEFGAAIWKSGKPVLVLCMEGARISRLIGGMVDHHQDQVIQRVLSSVGEAPSYVMEAIALYELDTPNPAQFMCLDYFLKREGLTTTARRLESSGWKS